MDPLALAAVALVVALAVLAADEWRVGLSACDITPEEPIFLAGYANRDHPFERVESRLSAKAMALQDSDGHRAVLVTADILGFSGAFTEGVWAEVERRTELGRAQVLLNPSHTHTGPMLRLDPTPRGRQSAEDAERSHRYTRGLQTKLVALIEAALPDMAPARLSWGRGVAHHVMNRREWTPTGVRLGVNPRGLADRSVPVLRVDDAAGSPRAVVYGSACHNTTLGPRHYFVCADWAGYSQAILEGRHEGAQAMFTIGCAGDANPYPRDALEHSLRHGMALADEVSRVLGTELTPVRGPLTTLLETIDLPLEAAPPREEAARLAESGPGWARFTAGSLVELYDRGETPPTHYTTPTALWQFGQDLTLVGLSGEVPVDYVTGIDAALGHHRLWISAYCNDVYGYLPSQSILRDGGYEARGLYAGAVGNFAAAAEEALVAQVRSLAARAGRVVE